MERMDNDALRERVTTALLSDGPVHPDLAVSRVLAALGLDDLDAAVDRCQKAISACDQFVAPCTPNTGQVRVGLEAALTATEER